MTYACIWYFLSMHWYTYEMGTINWPTYHLCHSLYATCIIKGMTIYMNVSIQHILCYQKFSLMPYNIYNEWWIVSVLTKKLRQTSSYTRNDSTPHFLHACTITSGTGRVHWTSTFQLSTYIYIIIIILYVIKNQYMWYKTKIMWVYIK